MSRHIHPAIDALRAEHQRFLEEADAIRTTLDKGPGRRALRALVKELLLFEETDFRAHLDREDQCLLSVVREHLSDTHPAEIDRDRTIRARLAGDMEVLRHGHKTGAEATATLIEMERLIRDYVQYEEKTLLPWIEKTLGDMLLEEVDVRYQASLEEAPVEVAADLTRLAN